MTFRNKKIFLVSMMNNWNFVAYVQRQINHILRKVRHFVKTFIDDIVTKSRFFNEHFAHLRSIFKILLKYNISIKLTKMFSEYLNVVLLKQRVNALRLSTTNKKLKVIKFKVFRHTQEFRTLFWSYKKHTRSHLLLCSNCQVIAKS